MTHKNQALLEQLGAKEFKQSNTHQKLQQQKMICYFKKLEQ